MKYTWQITPDETPRLRKLLSYIHTQHFRTIVSGHPPCAPEGAATLVLNWRLRRNKPVDQFYIWVEWIEVTPYDWIEQRR